MHICWAFTAILTIMCITSEAQTSEDETESTATYTSRAGAQLISYYFIFLFFVLGYYLFVKPCFIGKVHPEANNLPSYWENNGRMFVPLCEDSQTDKHAIDAIKTLMYNLWKPRSIFNNSLDINITNIERVENEAVFKAYAAERAKVFQMEKKHGHFLDNKRLTFFPVETTNFIQDHLSDSCLEQQVYHNVDEHYMFHGTGRDVVYKICKEGFCIELAHAGFFGTGAYFAEDPSKSDQYTDRTDCDQKMLLVRVCVGEVFILKEKGYYNIRSPPCTKPGCNTFGCNYHTGDKQTFDAVVFANKNIGFREYIVYKNCKAYPEYVITYERKTSDLARRPYKMNPLKRWCCSS